MSHTTNNPGDLLSTYTDAEVIFQVVNGEKRLFEILIRRNNPYLYKLGRCYGFNHEDTQDLMQETYLNAYLHLADFKQMAQFRTWIARIMLNQCYQRTQKSSFKNEIPTNSLPEEKNTLQFTPTPPDNEKLLFNKELGQIIEAALLKIPLDYRLVFSMRELNGMSIHETSQALNISEVNVKVRLNRAKNMLKKELMQLYSPAEIFEFNLVYCNLIVTHTLEQIAQMN
jgi:RNA polymerase sigma-70 factor (ECF subfamily)